jgi:hypothetical protein
MTSEMQSFSLLLLLCVIPSFATAFCPGCTPGRFQAFMTLFPPSIASEPAASSILGDEAASCSQGGRGPPVLWVVDS